MRSHVVGCAHTLAGFLASFGGNKASSQKKKLQERLDAGQAPKGGPCARKPPAFTVSPTSLPTAVGLPSHPARVVRPQRADATRTSSAGSKSGSRGSRQRMRKTRRFSPRPLTLLKSTGLCAIDSQSRLRESLTDLTLHPRTRARPRHCGRSACKTRCDGVC